MMTFKCAHCGRGLLEGEVCHWECGHCHQIDTVTHYYTTKPDGVIAHALPEEPRPNEWLPGDPPLPNRDFVVEASNE